MRIIVFFFLNKTVLLWTWKLPSVRRSFKSLQIFFLLVVGDVLAVRATALALFQALCCTFSFLQFVLPAVTLASDELPVLQASLDGAESEDIEPSVFPWKQNKSRLCFAWRLLLIFLLCFKHPPTAETMVSFGGRITRRLLKTGALSEA